MSFVFQERVSDSSFVDTVWYTQSENAGAFTSIAVSQWEMVVTKQYGKVSLTVRGPQTKATPAPIPANAEFLGIRFRLGTFMPHLPAVDLVDNPIDLPEARSTSFWLNGSA